MEQADEFWQWRMPVPHDDGNGGLTWLRPHFEIGLVARGADGRPRLVLGGCVDFSYDPWSGRVATGD